MSPVVDLVLDVLTLIAIVLSLYGSVQIRECGCSLESTDSPVRARTR